MSEQKLEKQQYGETEWEEYNTRLTMPDGSIVKIGYDQFLPDRQHRQVKIEVIPIGEPYRPVTMSITLHSSNEDDKEK